MAAPTTIVNLMGKVDCDTTDFWATDGLVFANVL